MRADSTCAAVRPAPGPAARQTLGSLQRIYRGSAQRLWAGNRLETQKKGAWTKKPELTAVPTKQNSPALRNHTITPHYPRIRRSTKKKSEHLGCVCFSLFGSRDSRDGKRCIQCSANVAARPSSPRSSGPGPWNCDLGRRDTPVARNTDSPRLLTLSLAGRKLKPRARVLDL